MVKKVYRKNNSDPAITSVENLFSLSTKSVDNIGDNYLKMTATAYQSTISYRLLII